MLHFASFPTALKENEMLNHYLRPILHKAFTHLWLQANVKSL